MKGMKIARGLLTVLCAFTLAACGVKESAEDDLNKAGNPSVTEDETVMPDSESRNREDGDSLIAFSTAQGSVVEFSDNGCIITPVEASQAGEGKLAVEAAWGSDIPEDDNTLNAAEIFIVRYQGAAK